MEKSDIEYVVSIAKDGHEALKLIRVMERMEIYDLTIVQNLIKTINDTTDACWNETDGRILVAYGQKALDKWRRLGALIEALIALTSPDIISQLKKPKRVAILCGDGFVVDSGVPFPKDLPYTKWHALAPDKTFALATIDGGEQAVLGLLAYNNQN